MSEILRREADGKITALRLIILHAYAALVVLGDLFAQVEAEARALGLAGLLVADAVEFFKYIFSLFVADARSFVAHLQLGVAVGALEGQVYRPVAGRVFVGVLEQVAH